MGEKGRFAVDEEHQAIHPYIDKDIFFREQWVYAISVSGTLELSVFMLNARRPGGRKTNTELFIISRF
jgi:hypothetical protein